jgi:hypothetical protein
MTAGVNAPSPVCSCRRYRLFSAMLHGRLGGGLDDRWPGGPHTGRAAPAGKFWGQPASTGRPTGGYGQRWAYASVPRLPRVAVGLPVVGRRKWATHRCSFDPVGRGSASIATVSSPSAAKD